jgi:hypothetical protein
MRTSVVAFSVGLCYKIPKGGAFMQKDTAEIVKQLQISPNFQCFYRENKEYIRRINRFDTIYDVSVVDFPAYDDTSIEARNEQADYFKELEKREIAERKRRLMLMAMC